MKTETFENGVSLIIYFILTLLEKNNSAVFEAAISLAFRLP